MRKIKLINPDAFRRKEGRVLIGCGWLRFFFFFAFDKNGFSGLWHQRFS